MKKIHENFGFMYRSLLIATMLCAGETAMAQTPAAVSARYTLTDNDASVVDGTTGLTWKRCQEGKKWNGTTCRGTERKYTLDEARALPTGEWRLPTMAELSSIKENVGPSQAAINREFFPNTSRGWFWTSSAGFRDDKGCTQNVSFIAYYPLRCHLFQAGREEFSFPPMSVRLVRGASKTDAGAAKP